jgi:hypothetical protein
MDEHLLNICIHWEGKLEKNCWKFYVITYKHIRVNLLKNCMGASKCGVYYIKLWWLIQPNLPNVDGGYHW